MLQPAGWAVEGSWFQAQEPNGGSGQLEYSGWGNVATITATLLETRWEQ